MIAVEGITKRYGGLVAVDRLSFEIRRGEVVGFLGPNGAGKSTTMKILTGALQPDEGSVRYDGVSIGDDLKAAKRRVGYLPENNALYPEMLVSEYLGFAARLRGLPPADVPRALARAVEQTGVEPVFTRPVGELSKGFRQRVGLAAAILHEPEILVLDEPTEGLDPNQRVGIRALISELGKDRTVLLSTHVLGEVEATCTRLVIIHRGRLAADGSAADLLDAQRAGGRYVVEIEGDDVGEGLSRLPGVTGVRTEAVDGRVRAQFTAVSDEDLRPVVFRLATRQGWTLWELHRERESLERLFRILTSTEGGHESGGVDATDDPPAPPAASEPAVETPGGVGTEDDVALLEGGAR